MTLLDKSLIRIIRDGFFAQVFWPLLIAIGSVASSYIAWQVQATAIAGLLAFFAVLFTVATFFVAKAAYAVHFSFGSPKYKIVVEAFPAIVHPQGNDLAIIPRLKLVNHGGFPIQVDSSKSVWSVDGKTGEEEVTKNKLGVVPPFNWQWLAGPKFIVPAPHEGIAEVTVEISINIRYGLPDKLNFSHIAVYHLTYLYYPSLETEGSLSLSKLERFA